ncbi:hypothetical protein OsJ_30840 [Oryza sativa Japonica Group]|uniref:Uncharacterized protein n=1 Tax=Oryza sativa subsp. japonica TaxID=39947 RepID=B9G7P8_ORYSJ|nr:hypothetical protein OsJ_30840 [Oryza sativa Japonica Group]
MDGIPKLTANELRRQRDRERYAALSVEEKAARVQKNRENRKRKKSASTSGTETDKPKEVLFAAHLPYTAACSSGNVTVIMQAPNEVLSKYH